MLAGLWVATSNPEGLLLLGSATREYQTSSRITVVFLLLHLQKLRAFTRTQNSFNKPRRGCTTCLFNLLPTLTMVSFEFCNTCDMVRYAAFVISYIKCTILAAL